MHNPENENQKQYLRDFAFPRLNSLFARPGLMIRCSRMRFSWRTRKQIPTNPSITWRNYKIPKLDPEKFPHADHRHSSGTRDRDILIRQFNCPDFSRTKLARARSRTIVNLCSTTLSHVYRYRGSQEGQDLHYLPSALMRCTSPGGKPNSH